MSSQRWRLNGLVSDAISRAEKLDDAQSWREAADAYAQVAGVEAAIAFCEECPPDERRIGVLGHRVAMQMAEECEAHFRETPCEDEGCGFALCDRCNNAWRRAHNCVGACPDCVAAGMLLSTREPKCDPHCSTLCPTCNPDD